MTTMKENIPIPQKMDDDPSNGKIQIGDSVGGDEVTNGNSSGRKRPSDNDNPNESDIAESKDVMHDVLTTNDVNTNLVESVVPDLPVDVTMESSGTIGNKEENPNTDVSMNAEESVGNTLSLQETKDKDRDVESLSTPTVDLERPVKRARTAYFLFLEDHRAETQKQHPGEGVGSIARLLGQRWSEMTDAEKQPYHAKAALEKQRVATETELWKRAARAAGKSISIAANAKTAAASVDSGSLILPLGRVRKTCRLDPEVRGISKEALVLITKATERFTVQLGQECVKTAHIQNRRTLLPQDVVDVCQIRECFQFLKDDIQDLHRHQQQVHADSKASSNAAATKGKGNLGATVATKPLTAYFKPAV